jgi:hypothetical protein
MSVVLSRQLALGAGHDAPSGARECTPSTAALENGRVHT